MNEQEFRIQVISDLEVLKNEVTHIQAAIPKCEKHSLKQKVNNNRRGIWIILVIYVPLLITVVTMGSTK